MPVYQHSSIAGVDSLVSLAMTRAWLIVVSCECWSYIIVKWQITSKNHTIACNFDEIKKKGR